MKTMTYVERIDKAIPDMTMEILLDKGLSINKDLKNTALCVAASGLCISQTIIDMSTLAAIMVKTGIKETVKAVNEKCDGRPVVIVRR